jgi:hypothetical protein
MPRLASAQAKATITGVPDIPFTSVPNFLKLPPGDNLGESVAVATNSKGNVFVFHRRDTTRLYEFDKNGAFIKEIGKGYYGFEFAHSVRVDKDDNIWTVDEGTNLVTKFSPQGKVLMVIGRRPPAVDGPVIFPVGPNPPAQKYILCRPTDVGWDPQGNIFISDGYVNHRVVKFDKNGRFVKQVGSERPGSEPSQFNTPHGIAVDNNGNVYVADRGNNRIQVLDNELNFKAQYLNVGSPWTVCVSPGAHQYLFTSNSNYPNNFDNGEIYKMELDGKIIGRFGEAGKQMKQFGSVHEIDCRDPNGIIVGELTNWRAQKLLLKAPTNSTK